MKPIPPPQNPIEKEFNRGVQAELYFQLRDLG